MTQFKTGDAFDKNGNILHEFDVVKIFHFTGARRKRHYMYKWIRSDKNGRLCMMHLSSEKDSQIMVPLDALTTSVNGRNVLPGAEIVQSIHRESNGNAKWPCR